MMNIFSRGKCHLAGMLLVAVASAATLQAAPEAHAKKEAKKKSPQVRGKPQYTTLSLSLETLKELGPRFQGPKNIPLSKMIGEVIDHAQAVVNQGSKAHPVEVNKAVISVKKLLNYLKQKKGYNKNHFSSSSSVLGGCNVCSEISELESEVAECCSQIKGQIFNLLRILQAESPCNDSIAINNVPFTITAPGKYCVTRDLVYTGSGAAITVNANNVSINFNSHSLTLNNSGAIGVLAQNVSEFTLENDVIEGAALYRTATSAAVSLVGVQKATLTNIYTLNTTKGVMIENSTDVLIENSLLSSHQGTTIPTVASIGAGIWVDTSSHVAVDGCTFQGAALTAPLATGEASNAIIVQGASSDVTLQSSTFANWLNTITLTEATGVLIENCMADASNLSISNLLELGSATTQANDIVIRNTTFRQATSVPGFDGLLFLNGSGCLIENVIVDVTTVRDTNASPYFPGAFHIGCAVNGHVSCTPVLGYSNILAKNCIVRGANEFGLFIENGSYLTFTDSQFTDASSANILFNGGVDVNNVSIYGALGCTVKNSTVTSAVGNGSGIIVAPGATTNAIVNCEISNNSQKGLVVLQYANENLIKGNNVFGNGNIGLENGEPTTTTYFNTSCFNTTANCLGVTPAQAPGGPNAVVAGSNVCCTP